MVTATLSASLVELRTHMPEPLQVLPDDVFAALLTTHGPAWQDWLGGYKSLARSRGVALLTVLTAASQNRLSDIISRR